MIDLTTNYMNIKVMNPIVVGSCSLTGRLDSIIELEKAGAGAVVLKSLFEEQIVFETEKALAESVYHPEAEIYLDNFIKANNIDTYLKLIKDAKANVTIPVIASISCITSKNWISFAKDIENAGADGLELNIFKLPSDPDRTDNHNEELIFEIIDEVKKSINIPIAVKISPYYTNLASLIKNLSHHGISNLVLFNRFYQPDIDIENEKLVNGYPYSSEHDMTLPLRWVAITSDIVDCGLVASTGIHNGRGVIKQLLVGAEAVQMVSAIYTGASEAITKTLSELQDWMEEHNYKSISEFKGKLSQSHVEKPDFFERVQFLKHYSKL